MTAGPYFRAVQQIEKETTTAYRWWSVEELEGTAEVVHPGDLAVILRKVTGERA